MEQTSIARDTANDTVLKYLKIKLGVCRRMTKEVAHYKKEAEENQEIVNQLTLEGADEWKLKQPALCVEESYAMILESGSRLQTGMDELYSFIIKFGEDEIMSEGEGLELKEEAETLLAESWS